MRPVNLLPAKHRARGGAGDSRASYIALGALGALVLAVLFFVITANQVSSRNAEIAKTRQQIQQAESQVVTLGSFGDFAGVKEARVSAVKTLATARLDWERLFRELAHVLPKGVWLTSFDGMVTSGDTGSGSGAEGPSGPTADLRGCAASYSRVADVLVRLRELHGVEEVVLTKSAETSEGGGTAAAVPATPGASGGDCGEYNAFEVTLQLAPLDTPAVGSSTPGAAVPARLGGGR